MKKIYVLFSFLLAAIPGKLFSQGGTLDSDFDADGIVTTDFNSSDDYAQAMAIQPDGKIVVCGYTIHDSISEFCVSRYNVDGSLDMDFNGDGKLIFAINSNNSEGNSVAIQPDSKIVIAGNFFNGTDNDFAVVRFNSDGSLDTFGGDGFVTTDITGADTARSVTLQTDGKIIVAGNSFNGTDGDFAVIRYNYDGTLDTSFSVDGKVTTDISGNDRAYAVIVQLDGKIVVGGNSFDDLVLVRYNPDGTLDYGFGIDGKVITAIGADDDGAYSIAIQADEKIVAAGFSFNGLNRDFALARYFADGTLDTTFGSGGKVVTGLGSANDEAHAVSIQSDSKILAAGYSVTGDGFDFTIARYTSNGSLDTSFNTDGIVVTDMGPDDFATAMALQTDGRIVVAGYSLSDTDYNFALTRYLSGLGVGIINFSSAQTSLLIYPNPLHQSEQLEYTLTKDEVLTLNLYDVKGRVIKNFFTQQKRTTGGHIEQLTMDDIAAGNYFLTISNGEQNLTVKVVKE